jgi:hypothetical protein
MQSAPLFQADEERQASISRATEEYSAGGRKGDYNLDSASFPTPEPKNAVLSWRDRSHNKRDRLGILQAHNRFFVPGVLGNYQNSKQV